MKTETRDIVLGALHKRREDIATEIGRLVGERDLLDVAIADIAGGAKAPSRRPKKNSTAEAEESPQPPAQEEVDPNVKPKKRRRKSPGLKVAQASDIPQSKYKGVWWFKLTGKWQSAIRDPETGKKQSRTFENEDEAAEWVVENSEQYETIEDLLR